MEVVKAAKYLPGPMAWVPHAVAMGGLAHQAYRAYRPTSRQINAARSRLRPRNRGVNYARNAVALREKGYKDTQHAAEDVTGGTFTLLNGIAQGSSATTRRGDKAKFHSVQITGFVKTGTTGAGNTLRYLIVWDKAANGVGPTLGDILDTTLGYNYLQNRDLKNAYRFQILLDRSITLSGNSATATMNAAGYKGFKAYVNLSKKNLVTGYNASGTTVGEIDTGSMYLVTIGSQTTGTTATNSAAIVRVRFTS